MAESGIPVKHLGDITECAICRHTCTDPRTLPCNHSFCLKCITARFRDKHPRDCVLCPFCQKGLEIPDNGVDNFPKNNFIANLLAVKEQSAFCLKPQTCDWCTSAKRTPCGTATDYCPDCLEFLCETCKRLHVRQHIGHTSRDIEQVVDDFKTSVNKSISQLVDGVNKLDRSLAALEARRRRIMCQASNVGDAICKKAELLKQMIDRQKDKLLSDVNQLKLEKVKVIDNDIVEVTQNKVMTESLITYCQELLQKGSNSDISREYKSVNAEAQKKAKFFEKELTFNTSEQLISFTAAEIITDAINCVGKLGDLDNHCQEQIFSPTLTNSVAPSPAGIAAIAAFDGALFIAQGDCSSTIEIYDTSTLLPRQQVAIPRCKSYGLATCSTSNCLYVSDYAFNKIHKVSMSTYSVTTSWSVAERPRELSVNRSHNLLVSCYESMKIQEYSSNGSLVREISGSNHVWQAVELNDGTLAVTRLGPAERGVCVMAVDGSILRSYGSLVASESGLMHSPRSLLVDKQGFIVVADQNYYENRIVVLNPTLTDSRLLPLPVSPGLTNPCGLCYDESRGRLYVGEWEKRILVFDNAFNLGSIFSQKNEKN